MTKLNLIIIVAHFDFSNSELRNEALKKCIQSIDEKIPIVLIRYVAPENKTRIERSNLICLDVNKAGVLWQRERFWNIALEYIQNDCENVAWIDSDICFNDRDWIDKTTTKLESQNLVHLFDCVIDKKLKGGSPSNNELERNSILSNFDNSRYQMIDYFGKSGISLSLGCSPGFAWAAKTRIMKKCLFPDFLILGSGDKALLAAAMGMHETYAKALKLNSYMTDKYLKWAESFFYEINGKVDYIDNTLIHIVQGEYKNRRYSNRYSLICDESFEFEKFIDISTDKTWIWKRESVYKSKVNEYFQLRED